MTTLAKKVVLDSTGDDGFTSVTIDGQEFPWHVSREEVEAKFDPDGGYAVVYLPVLAETLQFVTVDGGR